MPEGVQVFCPGICLHCSAGSSHHHVPGGYTHTWQQRSLITYAWLMISRLLDSPPKTIIARHRHALRLS